MLPYAIYVEPAPYVFWHKKALYINSLQLEREFVALMNRLNLRMTICKACPKTPAKDLMNLDSPIDTLRANMNVIDRLNAANPEARRMRRSNRYY